MNSALIKSNYYIVFQITSKSSDVSFFRKTDILQITLSMCKRKSCLLAGPFNNENNIRQYFYTPLAVDDVEIAAYNLPVL